MRKINFRQPKYIFPVVIFIPLAFLVYFVTRMFGSGDAGEPVATDRIISELPSANSREMSDKLSEMQSRFGRDDDAYMAVGALGDDEKDDEMIASSYTEDELDRIDQAMAEKIRQKKEVEDLERSLAESRRHINEYANSSQGSGRNKGSYDGYADTYESYADELAGIQQRSMERQRMLERAFGADETERKEAAERQRQDSIARERELELERNRPVLVIKSQDSNYGRFNSVTNEAEGIDAPLIRAMIDQTTKAHEGTRICFKLLDNVTIKDVRLPKGTYLYGIVTGFGQQRVKANITSILVGDRFIKVNLSVFDNDGMEGFYVPESAFRDFMRDAGSRTVQQNIQFDSGYGSGFSGEALALQALQNVYNSATSAVSANIRKNRAKIKYNTIVYLINSQDAR